VFRSTGNVYEFLGEEKDPTKWQYNKKVVVLAFKSNETGFYFLCARDGRRVALQVGVATVHGCRAAAALRHEQALVWFA